MFLLLRKQHKKNHSLLSLQVINFSSTTIAIFIGVVGILSIVAQVTHTLLLLLIIMIVNDNELCTFLTRVQG